MTTPAFSAVAAATRCEAVACRIIATRADVDETLRASQGQNSAGHAPHEPQLVLLAEEIHTLSAVADSLTDAVRKAAVIAPAVQSSLTRCLEDAETSWAVADKQLRRLRGFDSRCWTVDLTVLEDYEILLQAAMAMLGLLRELLQIPDAVRQSSGINSQQSRRALQTFADGCQAVLRQRDVLVSHDALAASPSAAAVLPPSPSTSRAQPPSPSAGHPDDPPQLPPRPAINVDPSVSPSAIAGPSVKLAKTKSSGAGGAGFLSGISQSFQAMTANFRYKPEPLVSALCQSAARGDLQQVRGFVEQGANVDGRNEDKKTALICAVLEQQLPIVQWLVSEAAADVRTKDGSNGKPPLFHAAAVANAELVQLLHAKGADASERNAFGEPYFTGVVQSGNPAMVRMLLELGSDANSRDVVGRHVLVEAVTAANIDVARALLIHGADASVRDISITGQTVLHIAATQSPERMDLVRLLLDHGADPNARDGTGEPIISHAAAKDKRELFRLLLARGADPNTRDIYGRTILQVLVRQRNLELIRSLLEHGASPNQLLDTAAAGGETLLLHAIAARDHAFAALLLKHGADPNAKDRQGRSPLMQALQQPPDLVPGAAELVCLLVEHGANPNAEAMCSPLVFATASGRSDIAMILRNHGAVPAPEPLPLPTLGRSAVASSSCTSLVLSPQSATGAEPAPSPGLSPRPSEASLGPPVAGQHGAAAPRLTVGEPDDDELPPDYDSVK